jgi:hypothetical protein
MIDIITGLTYEATHITRISGKSNSQKFQNWQHIFILRIFTAETGKFIFQYISKVTLSQ